MVVIAVLLAVAVVAGVGTWLGLRRWPILDPGAPAGAVHAVGDEVRRVPSTRWARRLDPTAVTGLALTFGIAVIVVGGGVLAILALLVRSNATLLHVDRGAATWGASHATGASTSILRVVTWGGATLPITMLALATALAFSRARHRVAIFGFLLAVTLGQTIVSNLVKVIVDRGRPTIHPLAGFSGASFPSGHTTAAFAVFAAVALLAGRGRDGATQAALFGAAVGLATAVGATRVLLGVHWLTDVLAGAALGLAWFAVVAIAFGGRLMQFGLPVEAGQRAADLTESPPAPPGPRSARP